MHVWCTCVCARERARAPTVQHRARARVMVSRTVLRRRSQPALRTSLVTIPQDEQRVDLFDIDLAHQLADLLPRPLEEPLDGLAQLHLRDRPVAARVPLLHQAAKLDLPRGERLAHLRAAVRRGAVIALPHSCSSQCEGTARASRAPHLHC